MSIRGLPPVHVKEGGNRTSDNQHDPGRNIREAREYKADYGACVHADSSRSGAGSREDRKRHRDDGYGDGTVSAPAKVGGVTLF